MNSLFTKTFLKSLIPLVIGTTSHLIKTILILNSETMSPREDEQALQRFYFTASAITKNGILQLYSCYFSFLLTMLFLEIIIQAALLAKKSFSKSSYQSITLEISTDLPSLKSATTAPMSKKIVLYIIRLVLLYSLCYFLYLVLFAVISVSCNSYIQQRSPLQLQAPLQESQTRNLEDTYPIIFKNYAKTGPKPSYSIPPIQQVRALLDMSTSAVVFSNDSTIAFIAACTPSELYSDSFYYLQILNITNLASPSLLGSLQFSDTYRQCIITKLSLLLSTDEKTVFMNLENALQIIDVSNLTSPANITTSPSYISEDSNDGLLLLDFLPGHRGLLAFGLHSFMEGDIRLEFINITDFLHPSLILPSWNLVLPPNSNLPKVYVYGESMYIGGADNSSSLAFWEIYDISNLKNITVRETMVLPVSNGILSIAFSSNYQVAYVAVHLLWSPGFELITIDISNKAAPKIMGSVNATIGLSNDDIPRNGIVASPDNSHIFIVGHYSLEIFDVSDPKAPILLLQTSIPELESIFISPNGQVALACTHGSPDQIYIVQVYIHIEATQVIDMQDNILGKISTNITEYFEQMFLSPDGNTLYIPLFEPNKNITLVIDISNPNSPVRRPALHLEGDPNAFLLSFDGQTLFIIDSPCTLQAYDIPTTTYLSSFPLGLGKIYSLILSSDGKTLFILGDQRQDNCTNFVILNVMNLAQPSVLTNITNTGEYLKVLTLSKDGKTAFLAGDDGAFFIYDVSSPASPVPLPPFRGPWKELRALVTSPNGQTAFIISGEGPSLWVIDISILDTPILLTSIKPILSYDIILSSDGQILFLPTGSVIVALNVSIPASPIELGRFPYEYVNNLAISPDSSTLFMNTDREIIMVNLKPEYLLYLDTNTFPLGETVSINLYVLQRNSNKTYDVVISPYQFTDVSLSTVQYGSTAYSAYSAFGQPIINDIGMPNWASFDQSTGILTFSPNSQYTVGNYYINSTISKQVNTSAFNGIANINTTAESRDLVITLITLGYLNNQRFLTSSFDPSQPMLLSSQYSSNETEKQIRSVLADHYIEMTTQVFISPSLGLVLNNSTYSPSNQMISITSPSPNPVSLNITLNPVNGVETRFVNKDYLLTPTFTPDQSTIHFIGSLLDINTVLSQLIVFMNGLESCDGSIMISDGLNQPITRLVPDISSYFLNSSQPSVDISYLLDQVSQRPLKTGEQFVIPFDPSTFTVTNGEDLTLNLKMQDNKTEVPYWLMLRGFDLTGTPPNQLTGREIKVKIVASNGYQEYEVPFTLNIGISFTYALELLIKYGGGFITFIGLILLAHRVYNIVCKRMYRYPKNFIVRPGEEINSKILYPIAFISKELAESRLITKYIDKKIAKGIKKASKSKIALFFTDPSTLQLDESKLVSVIEETVLIILADQKMISKLKLYNALLNSRKKLIDQLIISEFTIRLLDIGKEKPTKAAFAKIKKHIFSLVNFVECSEYGICKFSIQRQQLQKELAAYNIKLPSVPVNKEIITPNQPDFDSDLVGSPKNSDSRKSIHIEGSEHNRMHQNSLEKPLIPFDVDDTQIHSKTNINVNLLINAIEAYAFRHHNLNAEAPAIHVLAKRRLTNISPPKWLKRFMKWDLQSIGYSEKSQNLGYGIRYTIENGILNFFGTVDYDMKDEVLVVQITNIRGRILRELWLEGIEGQPEDALGEAKDLLSC